MNTDKHEVNETSIDQTGKNLADLSIMCGDALTELRKLPAESIHCCVTSPPYFGLRNYEMAGQIGLENDIEDYVNRLVAVFSEVRRVLHPSGTFWLNIGDSYAVSGKELGKRLNKSNQCMEKQHSEIVPSGLKPKDLCLIPYRVAMALQSDDWYLRNQIVWAKKSPMPESVRDRPTRSWEPIFLFSKSRRYYYDAVALAEPSTGPKSRRPFGKAGNGDRNDQNRTFTYSPTRNMRDVWLLGPAERYHGRHFARFPSESPRRAILAGTSEKGCCPVCLTPWRRVVEKQPVVDTAGNTGEMVEAVTVGWEPTCQCNRIDTVPCTVLDPFGGSGTSGKVALELGRKAILIELNPAYCALIRERCVA
jgi:DNA modification methylase